MGMLKDIAPTMEYYVAMKKNEVSLYVLTTEISPRWLHLRKKGGKKAELCVGWYLCIEKGLKHSTLLAAMSAS